MQTPIHQNLDVPGEPLKPYWKKLITAGRAAEGLREDWRDQLREVQREIGFEYIRFHGIFHDDMMVYHEDDAGQPYFNWQYYDALMDFLRDVRLRPILELSFMPTALKTEENTVFWWKGNITPPIDHQKWAAMIRALVVHSIDRYGLEEVLKWYFEVWNEPDLYNLFWHGSQEEYFKLYRVSVEAIKAVHPGLRVGGPATSGRNAQGEAPWITEFLAFCAKENVPVEFVTTHPYPNTWAFDGAGGHKMGYDDPNRTKRDLQWIREAVDTATKPGSGLKPVEIHLTEWSSSPSSRDLIHDTAFMAPFIIDNNVRCIGLVDSLGFWTFTDVFEERAAGDTLFHGGFGLVNTQGLKKASYYGYWFLAQLGDTLLSAGENYIITRQGEDFQVLLWNYCDYKADFADGNRSALSHLDRYQVFEEQPGSLQLHLEGVNGPFKVVERIFDREHGSAFDAWLRNGALEAPTQADLEILQRQTGPTASISLIECSGAYQREIALAPHGVCLITLQRRYLG